MTVVDETVHNERFTWNEAAAQLIFEILTFGIYGFSELEDMRHHLDYMISKNSTNTPDAWMAPDEMAGFWKMLAAMTRDAAAAKEMKFLGKEIISSKSALWPEPVEKTRETAKALAEFLTNKQRDYGSDNITRFGRTGLLVRAHDKIARLENLAAKGTIPKNESLADNYFDVIGYCTIGMMLELGWFTLPLE